MSDEPTNIDLLRNHLSPESLANMLVTAYQNANEESKTSSLQTIMDQRLNELRKEFDHGTD